MRAQVKGLGTHAEFRGAGDARPAAEHVLIKATGALTGL